MWVESDRMSSMNSWQNTTVKIHKYYNIGNILINPRDKINFWPPFLVCEKNVKRLYIYKDKQIWSPQKVLSRPLLRLMYGEYWFRLSRLSMMVIGSFASYTKTKSVESAVWCLLTLDDDVETGNRQQVLEVLQVRNTWTEFRIRIVLFSFEQ
jgi:hypothetical protein